MMSTMVDVLAHPFRADGATLATLDSESVPAYAQEIAVLVGTRRGERDLVPGYGIPDPVFDQVDPTLINAGLARYGPENILVTAIDVTDVPIDIQTATLTFDVI